MIIQPYEEFKRFPAIGLMVSNRRVRYEIKGKICQSMSLTSISSIGLVHTSEPRFITYCVVTSVITYLLYKRLFDMDYVYAGGVLILYFVIRYILSRKNKLAVYGSGKDHIMINVDYRSYNTAQQVLDYVEDLKLKLE